MINMEKKDYKEVDFILHRIYLVNSLVEMKDLVLEIYLDLEVAVDAMPVLDAHATFNIN